MRESWRTCIGCRRREPPSALVRLRLDAAGGLLVAEGTGRGASIHPSAACVEAALRSSAFGRAFKRKVSLPDAAALLERLAKKPSLKDRLVKATEAQK